VDLLEVNLRAGEVTVHPWDAARLDEIRARLRLSIRGMKAWLRDADLNLAAIEDFEQTEELRLCRWCNFKAVCRPELTAEATRAADAGSGDRPAESPVLGG
jgi:hypothetical protein